MESRIMVSYLIEAGFNDIGDRDIEKDIYAFDEVKSIEDGEFIIANNEADGVGTIIEQSKCLNGIWDDDMHHHVDQGKIYQSQNL